MLTKVILDGPLGKRFGSEWDLAVSTPNEAIRMIEANHPGIVPWIRMNSTKFANYRVTITDQHGKKVKLNNDTYGLQRSRPATIRFTPIVTGRSAGARIVVGAILIIVGTFFPALGAFTIPMGVGLAIGGLVEMLSPQPKKEKNGTNSDGTSYYFNGAVNTSTQGNPVALVYGRHLVGSQAVSVSITIDQQMG